MRRIKGRNLLDGRTSSQLREVGISIPNKSKPRGVPLPS